jgi:hypothetical protein
MVGRPGMDEGERDNLLLLALQSPGGPRTQLKILIDQLLREHFTKNQVPVVRMFLNKISEPKYRSAEQMRREVGRFDPAKWFTHAYNNVRREMLDELQISAQSLTNILGSKASNVFHFMRTKVGKHPTVRRILNNLAEQIELLEPGFLYKGARKADTNEHDAEITSDPTASVTQAALEQWFEKDEYGEWDRQVGPHPQHLRGPVPLRVARAWVAS